MSTLSDDLCHVFLGAQGAEDAPPGLAAALATGLARAAAAWPDLRIDHPGFVAYLGSRIPSDVDPIDALDTRALPELFLAFACLAGDPEAHAQLDETYIRPLVAVLVQQGIASDLARDVVQKLRMQLLTGERPLLRLYSGIGALKGWLRITTLREAIRAQRKARASEADELNDALVDGAADPALQYQRRLYQDEFRSAFAEAVAGLAVRDRNLLKQSVLYGATVDDLGALYQVHRATAARWIAAARERLAELTKQRMIEKLEIDPTEYDSILQLIHSQLDVSVRRVLDDRPGPR